ncbi:hypothetical protein PM082_014017 [Marasmius tenuissimus]|nr:hypothetical protein PM082_014017 [Marasmius tenuissimus]
MIGKRRIDARNRASPTNRHHPRRVDQRPPSWSFPQLKTPLYRNTGPRTEYRLWFKAPPKSHLSSLRTRQHADWEERITAEDRLKLFQRPSSNYTTASLVTGTSSMISSHADGQLTAFIWGLVERLQIALTHVYYRPGETSSAFHQGTQQLRELASVNGHTRR